MDVDLTAPLAIVVLARADSRFDSDRRAASSLDLGLVGELDLATAGVIALLVEREIAAGELDVCIDLSRLVFCDVRGLRALVQARRDLGAAGGRLTLSNPRPLLRRTAALGGVDGELGWLG